VKLFLKILLWTAALTMFLVVLAFGCVYLLECFGPGMAAERIKVMTGFRLDIASLKLSLLKGSAEIDDARLQNPPNWPEDDFLTIDRALVAIKPTSFIGEKRREIDEVVLEVGTVNLVTDSRGRNNAEEFFDSLKPGKDEAELSRETKKPSQEKKAEKPQGYVIHHLVLKTTSLRYIDHSTPGARPIVIPFEYEIDLHEVTDFKEVQKKFLAKFRRSFLWGVLESTQWHTGGC
jgi:hypothetical protein